jgi:hypothetical protein
MNKVLFGLLAIAAIDIDVHAEVFKCKSSTGAMQYQSAPCAPSDAQLGVVDIKPMDPQQQEQARLKLQAWQEVQAANGRAKVKAEKERQAQQNKQAELNALNRSAAASEQQALAAQRMAGQMEHQNRLNSYNSLYVPRYNYGQPNQAGEMRQNGLDDNDADDAHRRRHGHEGRHERRHDEALQHQQQLGDYGVYRPEGSLGNALGGYEPVK